MSANTASRCHKLQAGCMRQHSQWLAGWSVGIHWLGDPWSVGQLVTRWAVWIGICRFVGQWISSSRLLVDQSLLVVFCRLCNLCAGLSRSNVGSCKAAAVSRLAAMTGSDSESHSDGGKQSGTVPMLRPVGNLASRNSLRSTYPMQTPNYMCLESACSHHAATTCSHVPGLRRCGPHVAKTPAVNGPTHAYPSSLPASQPANPFFGHGQPGEHEHK